MIHSKKAKEFIEKEVHFSRHEFAPILWLTQMEQVIVLAEAELIEKASDALCWTICTSESVVKCRKTCRESGNCVNYKVFIKALDNPKTE